MSTIVGVQFRNTGKIYYFAPGKLTFAKGEGAIVETARGLEMAEASSGNTVVREREVVHFQRFGEALNKATEKMNQANVYFMNPAFPGR